MSHFLNPLLPDELQKREKIKQLVGSDGQVYDVNRLLNLINAKVQISQDQPNCIMITDMDGNVTTIPGVVMTAAEREKLKQLTEVMILKGVMPSEEAVKAVENPELGWVYFVESSPNSGVFLEYCYCETGWEVVGSTGGETEFHTDKKTTISVGNIPKGANLDGYTFQRLVEEMFYPEINMDNFVLKTNESSTKEVGSIVRITTVSQTHTAGSTPIQTFKVWSDSSKSVLLGESTGGAITIANYQGTSVYGEISNGKQTLNATWKVTFINPYFYGTIETKTPESSDLQQNKQLTNAASVTYKLTSKDNYMFFAYPASYNDIVSIKDANNFEYMLKGSESWEKTIVKMNLDGRNVDYKVYIRIDQTRNSNFSLTFKRS